MKKLLALVLALVMTLSLCTITNAADFTDKADVDYTEAVEVMKAVGVLDGFEDGSFKPDQTVTRAQAAKIIAYLDLGKTAADAMTKDVTPFKDVAAGNWATGYITYCYNAGIIAGVGDGMFAPDAQVTALQFAKMLLVVLGYKADVEGLNGADWSLNTAKLAATCNLFDGNNNIAVNAAATRQEASLYAFNALKAECVKYAVGTTTVKGDGIEVTVGGSAASHYSDALYGGAIDNEDNAKYLQLGEKLYKGDLEFDADEDDMNRPANVWSWKNVDIGAYAAAPDHTFVVNKAAKTFDDMIDNISKKYDTTTFDPDGATATYGAGDIVSINGGAWAAASTPALVGDIVEVYMDDDDGKQVDQVIVTRYLGAYKLSADPATKSSNGVDYVRLPGVTPLSSFTDVEDITGYQGLAKDDVVYYYTDGTTHYVAKAVSFEGKLTSHTTGTLTKYTIDGTAYCLNAGVATGTAAAVTDLTNPVYNTGYKYYTDNNGYIVFAEAVEETLSDYVVVEEIKYVGAGSGIGATASVEARLVKMDGTVEIVKVASVDDGTNLYKGTTQNTTATTNNAAADYTSGDGLGRYLVYHSNPALNTGLNVEENMMFTYKVDSNGKYELKKASGTNIGTGAKDTSAASTDYKASTGKLNGIKVDDNTVFVVQNLTEEANGNYKYNVYTGKNACPVFTSTSANNLQFCYATKKDVATYVYVYAYSNSTVTGETVYILDGTAKSVTEVKNADNTTFTYQTYDAVVDGKVVDLKVKANPGSAIVTGGLYAPTYNTDGYVTNLARDDARDKALAYGYSLTGTTLAVGKTYDANTYADAFDCDEDAVVIYKNTDGDYTEMTAAEFTADANDQIYVVLTSDTSDNEVYLLYIIEKDADETGLNYTASAGTVTKTAVAAAGGNPAYTNLAGASGANITLTAEAGCKIEVSTTSWTSGFSVYGGGSIAADTYVKVTAEDTTVAYYFVDITP